MKHRIWEKKKNIIAPKYDINKNHRSASIPKKTKWESLTHKTIDEKLQFQKSAENFSKYKDSMKI